jgi:hypothetical protein
LRLPSIAATVASALLLIACGSPAASTAPPIAGEVGPAFGCHGGDLILCQAMIEAAVESLGEEDGRPIWAEVARPTCDGQCQPGPGTQRSVVTLELVGDDAIMVAVELRDGQAQDAERLDIPLFAREPASGPAPGAEVAIELGHCGLASGIDVDGSFWNPIGIIPEHPDAINAARATFTLAASGLATIRTEGGLVVQLARNAGPKHFPACD